MNLTVQTNRPRWMRPIRTEDFAALELRAKEDNHNLVMPNYIFEKHGQIVGAVSLGTVVLAMPWFHTTECKASDTIYFVNAMENLAANQMPEGGNGLLCVPCVQASPLHPFIERLGYRKAQPVTLTFRNIKD